MNVLVVVVVVVVRFIKVVIDNLVSLVIGVDAVIEVDYGGIYIIVCGLWVVLIVFIFSVLVSYILLVFLEFSLYNIAANASFYSVG